MSKYLQMRRSIHSQPGLHPFLRKRISWHATSHTELRMQVTFRTPIDQQLHPPHELLSTLGLHSPSGFLPHEAAEKCPESEEQERDFSKARGAALHEQIFRMPAFPPDLRKCFRPLARSRLHSRHSPTRLTVAQSVSMPLRGLAGG